MTAFSLANLPLGVGEWDGHRRAVVAIGDEVLDLHTAQVSGLLGDVALPDGVFATGSLNAFLAYGRSAWSALRERCAVVLGEPTAGVRAAMVERHALAMVLPIDVADYVDFYSSLHHATNLGRMFRPGGEALQPNWKHLPVGYHGRSGTVVVSGTDVVRPRGLVPDGAGHPVYGPTGALDIELEIGAVVGAGSIAGSTIAPDAVADHVAGLVLLNDWSARDIQAYEYQPLGPHLGKSFATSISPWVVSLDALEPFRVAPPVQDPEPDAYLRATQAWGYRIRLEVTLQSASMLDEGIPPMVVSRTDFASMYWTVAQQLAHVSANGASTRTGDLLGSGTVSGPDRGSEGSLIELTRRGAEPMRLPTGETRAFLHDGDRVSLSGWCDDAAGEPVLGFGDVTGTVLPAHGRS